MRREGSSTSLSSSSARHAYSRAGVCGDGCCMNSPSHQQRQRERGVHVWALEKSSSDSHGRIHTHARTDGSFAALSFSSSPFLSCAQSDEHVMALFSLQTLLSHPPPLPGSPPWLTRRRHMSVCAMPMVFFRGVLCAHRLARSSLLRVCACARVCAMDCIVCVLRVSLSRWAICFSIFLCAPVTRCFSLRTAWRSRLRACDTPSPRKHKASNRKPAARSTDIFIRQTDRRAHTHTHRCQSLRSKSMWPISR